MPNETIHNEIEEWLAADVHDQLADEERAAFEQHLGRLHLVPGFAGGGKTNASTARKHTRNGKC